MDRRTFVKAGCIGSASLLMQGLDPMMRADSFSSVLAGGASKGTIRATS